MIAPNKALGRWGEAMAQHFLQRHGYDILATNVHVGHGEIDIIAQQGGIVVFVEVKTRASQYYGDSVDALDDYKQDSLSMAVNRYLSQHELWDYEIRVDLVAIDVDVSTKRAKIQHYRDIL